MAAREVHREARSHRACWYETDSSGVCRLSSAHRFSNVHSTRLFSSVYRFSSDRQFSSVRWFYSIHSLNNVLSNAHSLNNFRQWVCSTVAEVLQGIARLA